MLSNLEFCGPQYKMHNLLFSNEKIILLDGNKVKNNEGINKALQLQLCIYTYLEIFGLLNQY